MSSSPLPPPKLFMDDPEPEHKQETEIVETPTKRKSTQKHKNYAVIDVETTGFGRSDEIVEIAIVLLDHDGNHKDWKIGGTFSTLVKPILKITNVDNEASRIHKITSRMVKNAPTFAEIAPIIGSLLNDRKLVGHNINRFDSVKLAEAFKRAKIRTPPISREETISGWVDTLDIISTEYLWNGLPNKKLGTLLDYYNIINPHPHSALGDTLGLAEAFTYMMEHSSVRHLTYRYYREVFSSESMTVGTNKANILPRYKLKDGTTTVTHAGEQIEAIREGKTSTRSYPTKETKQEEQAVEINGINLYQNISPAENLEEDMLLPEATVQADGDTNKEGQRKLTKKAILTTVFSVLSIFLFPIPFVGSALPAICFIVAISVLKTQSRRTVDTVMSIIAIIASSNAALFALIYDSAMMSQNVI